MFNLLKSHFSKTKGSYSKISQLRYLSQSALIEEAAAPHVVRTTLALISIIIIILIVWSSFTVVEEIAVTNGEVIPSKHIQSIQHLEGGIISEIKVVEGELVNAGQTIITLNGAAAKQDLIGLKSRKLSLEYEALRLRSFIDQTIPDFSTIAGGHKNSELEQEQMRFFRSMIHSKNQEREVIKEQIIQKQSVVEGLIRKQTTLKDSIKLAEEEKNLKSLLYEKGYLSKVNFLQIQQEFYVVKSELEENNSELMQARNAILEYESRLQSLEANSIEEGYRELNIVNSNLTQVKENITKLEEQVERLNITSPSYGFVKVLNIKTIGGVIESGQVLAEIVPLEGRLILEVQIQPKDIGYMKVSQPVNVKVSSYDFARYGSISGTLEYISATTFSNDDDSRYYMGRVALSQNYVGHDPKKNIIVPGMTVQADIVTGSKSILAYLLKPIHTSVSSAFSER